MAEEEAPEEPQGREFEALEVAYMRAKILQYASDFDWRLMEENHDDQGNWQAVFSCRLVPPLEAVQEGEEFPASEDEMDTSAVVPGASASDDDDEERACEHGVVHEGDEFEDEDGETEMFFISKPIEAPYFSVEFWLPIEPKFFKERVRQVLGLIADYGLVCALDDDLNEPDKLVLQLSMRVFVSGFNVETFECVTENLWACKAALIDFLENPDAPEHQPGYVEDPRRHRQGGKP